MTPHAVARSPKGKAAAAGEHRLSSFVALHHIHVDELLHADGHTLALAHSLWLTSTTSTRAHAHMRAERETEKETYRERERERGREGEREKEREERERHRDRHRHRHRLTERRCSETPGARCRARMYRPARLPRGISMMSDRLVLVPQRVALPLVPE